jgi:hypothetical protein
LREKRVHVRTAWRRLYLKINANAISRDGWGFLREFQLSSALGLGAGLPLVIENVFDGYCGYFGAFLTWRTEPSRCRDRKGIFEIFEPRQTK